MIRCAIIVVGSFFLAGCASSGDQDGRPLSDAEMHTTASVDRSGVEVCELVGRDSIVKVKATDAGTRYTLCTLEGKAIARDLDAEGLARLRPDLDPESMQAEWGFGAVMLMDRVE